MEILSTEVIQDTEAYKSASNIAKTFLTKRGAREIISNALIVYKNTGSILTNVTGNNLKVLNELIRNHHSANNPEPEI
jgi:hypothetical protein